MARVYLQTRKRFWLDDGFSGYASTDLPVMNISERSINQPGTRGILESYMADCPRRRRCHEEWLKECARYIRRHEDCLSKTAGAF